MFFKRLAHTNVRAPKEVRCAQEAEKSAGQDAVGSVSRAQFHERQQQTVNKNQN
jgi:hypothetical protein